MSDQRVSANLRGKLQNVSSSRRSFMLGGAGLVGAAALTHASTPIVQATRPFQTAEPKRGGSLRLALAHEPDSLDPQYLVTSEALRIVEQLYSTLVSVDKDMNIIPDLAEEWEINADATQFDFKLRQGVMFHHGREVEASDVEYTARRIADGSPYEYIFQDLDRITVNDKYSISFTFKNPSANFLAAMAPRWTGILAKEKVEESGQTGLRTSVAGSGPYKLVEWNPLQNVVLARNEDYYDATYPYLDEIIWTPVEDELSRVNQVSSGAMDLDIDGPPKLFDTYAGANGVEIIEGPICSFMFAGLNNARPPFDKTEARQAIAWAVDRQQIVDLAANGRGTPLLGGWIGPETHWAYSGLNIYSAPDPEKARALLQAAGVPDGTEVVVVAAAGGIFADIAQVMQQQLAPIGLTVTIEALEMGAATSRVFEEHDFDIYVGRWGTMIDPHDFTGQFFYSGTAGFYNFPQFKDPKADELMNKGVATSDQDERKKTYAELEQYLAADAVPYAFLYRPTGYAAYQGVVQGLQHEAANTRISLQETWLDQ